MTDTSAWVDPDTAWAVEQVLELEAHILDSQAWEELDSVFSPLVTVENEASSLQGLDALPRVLLIDELSVSVLPHPLVIERPESSLMRPDSAERVLKQLHSLVLRCV